MVSCSYQEQSCPSRDICWYLETSLVVTGRACVALLASSGWRWGILLSIPQCTSQSLMTNISSAEVEKSWSISVFFSLWPKLAHIENDIGITTQLDNQKILLRARSKQPGDSDSYGQPYKDWRGSLSLAYLCLIHCGVPVRSLWFRASF